MFKLDHHTATWFPRANKCYFFGQFTGHRLTRTETPLQNLQTTLTLQNEFEEVASYILRWENIIYVHGSFWRLSCCTKKNAIELTYTDEYPVHTMFLLEAICLFRQFGVTRTIRLLQYTFSRWAISLSAYCLMLIRYWFILIL
jgi:hypothetical protein